jgi:mxaJ protein
MSLRCLKILGALVLHAHVADAQECCGQPNAKAAPAATTHNPTVLRIAADPNNLPFSSDKLEGFENKIAAMIAQDSGRRIEWQWRAQRRGFFRETLKEDTCDLVMGAPAGYERALTTVPYYRSSYVFVTRKDRGLEIATLDDARLPRLKIGVQIIGDDGTNTPPAHALALRGVVDNLVGYTLFGDYAKPNPPARIIDAVTNGEVDVALAWGPMAGYFAKRSTVPLSIVPLPTSDESPGIRFAFSIAMGVRRNDAYLKQWLDDFIVRRRGDINEVLAEYGVPCLPMTGEGGKTPAEADAGFSKVNHVAPTKAP